MLVIGTSLSMLIPIALAGTFSLQRDDFVTNESPYIELKVAPGESVSDDFLVVNLSEETHSYAVSVNDASNTTEVDGFFALSDDTKEQSHIGKWGVLSTKTVTVEPGEYGTITLTFTLPEGTATGTYWGGVSAIVSDAISASENSEGGTSINSVIRNGLRVKVEVVDKEEFVQFLEELEMKEATKTNTTGISYYKYIITGLIIIIAGLFVTIMNQRNNKKKIKL
ncbi:MAG: hypothetical protein UW03_C0005G0002 [Candidatus Peregrinibacteria bacterium GW2011_GWA2_43_8]|nr:MAG: hypothetical protein UW03_C0005G0002 [Candidatus Peregrinibacteria bacterium GW2011_GWA2_43_8]